MILPCNNVSAMKLYTYILDVYVYTVIYIYNTYEEHQFRDSTGDCFVGTYHEKQIGSRVVMIRYLIVG